jgi:hypothetical protein
MMLRMKPGSTFHRSKTMWQLQLHAVFRVGGYRTPEIDITPALGVSLIVALFALIIKTGL